MEWIKNIVAALAIVEAIRATIVMFINAAETPGHGPQKKEAVLKGIKDTLTELKVAEPIQVIVLAITSGLIDIYVMVENIIGLFTHEEKE